MQRSTRWILASGFVLGLAGAVHAQPAGGLKVGVVNLKDIFDNYKKVKDFTKTLTDESEAVKQEIDLLEQELRSLQEKLKALEKVENKTKEDLQIQFIVAQSKREFLVKYNSERFSKRLSQRTADFYNEIRAEIENLGKAEGYDLIFKIDAPEVADDARENIITQRINHRPLLYAREGMDITPKVIQALNAKYDREAKDGQGAAQPPGGTVPTGAPPAAGTGQKPAAGGGTPPTPSGGTQPK